MPKKTTVAQVKYWNDDISGDVLTGKLVFDSKRKGISGGVFHLYTIGGQNKKLVLFGDQSDLVRLAKENNEKLFNVTLHDMNHRFYKYGVPNGRAGIIPHYTIAKLELCSV